MNMLYLAAIAIFIALLAVVFLLRSLPRNAARSPYRLREQLLSAAERSFFGVLRQSVDGDQQVFAKVRLTDLLLVPQGVKNWQAHQNRIQSKHVDFVVCDNATTKPLLVIELDDSSHERARQKARDAFVDEAAGHAGLPILHVAVKRSYAAAELRQLISSVLNQTAVPLEVRKK
jgi:very-short-patch-repair endonuclease